MRRAVLALVGSLVALTVATPSHATLNPCSAAKKKCVAKKAAALLKCHFKDEKPPGLSAGAMTTCLQKAKDKFDGGVTPAKGCFAKLEAKYPGGCLTVGDTTTLENITDAYVAQVVCKLDPLSGFCPVPTPTPTCPAPPPTPTPTSTPVGCFAVGQACVVGSQCCSNVCMGGNCQASCSDGIQDGSETGVDCGGGTCPTCPLGGGCGAASDCTNAICMAGQCTCGTGTANCDLMPQNGCEISTASDPTNCGTCGHICNLPNTATDTCISGVCHIGSCSPGYADCDAAFADGCEVNTTSDANNCGGCGLVCPVMFPNCVNSACQ